MQKVLLVFFGSGAGGVARFLIASWAVKTLGPAFPYGTIAINAIGSFLIVIIMQVSLRTDLIGPDLRLALTTGVMGGFTTYSTFNYESISLFQDGAILFGAVNIILTVLVCLGAGGLGLAMATWLLGAG